MADEQRVEALAGREPGEDPEDPYADVPLETLPDWWREAIEEFAAHDLRPYRPPRFADDELTQPLIDALEAELGVTVRLMGLDARYLDDWSVVVDGEPVAEVPHRRSPDGYSRFGIEADAFETLVREAAEGAQDG